VQAAYRPDPVARQASTQHRWKERTSLSVAVRTYHGLALDPFQVLALDAVSSDSHVLVSAPTGTGKTVIADFLIEQAVARGQRVVYTAPIKALSNQKYQDYVSLFGEETVGILTGDVSINPDAPVVIMTTEILRNQLITGDERLERLGWVVFDEIHFIATDRGIAWEESLILLPRGVRVLGLSATIGNLDALADWMEETLGAPVVRIREPRRAVPLQVRYVTPEGVASYSRAEAARSSGAWEGVRLRHLDIVDHMLEDALPALYFVFSRQGAEERAREAAQRHDLLTRAQRRELEALLAELKPRYPGARDLGPIERCLVRGIGYHHAGLLPATKRIVERLYAAGLIRLLYCTETFAVGVNYPVRGVAIETTRKFDGRGFRPLTVQEFQQMTGRAGRRGMDERGFAFIGVDGRDRQSLLNYSSLPLEPVRSQFFVTESTALNLLRSFGREDALQMLARNFHEYLRRQDRASMEAHLQQLGSRRAELWEQGCRNLGTARCPLQRTRVEVEARDVRRKRRRRSGRSRQAASRRLRALEAELAEPASCPRRSPDPCRPLEAPFFRVSEDLAEGQARLEQVPSLEAYRSQLDRVTRLLSALGYIDGDRLLARGEVARHLHVEPVLLTELLFSGFFQETDPDAINAVLGGVDYDARHEDTVFTLKPPPEVRQVHRLARRLRQQGATARFDPVVTPLVHRWSRGASFTELMSHTTIQEGDIIGAIRRAIDLLRQLRQAARGDAALQDKLADCSRRLDRDEAAVVF
jgi:superfamily II RNA helicase